MNFTPNSDLSDDLPPEDDVDLGSLPVDAVIIWFDADLPEPILGRQWVVAGFEAEAAWPDRPGIVPFFNTQLGYANEIEIAITGYGFDAARVIPNGLPAQEQLKKLRAELFDLYVAWAGLNYARMNHHEGPVLMLGDGKSAIQFMRHEAGLDLRERGVDTSAMRDLIEGLYRNFTAVEWKWICNTRNRRLGCVQDCLKRFLKAKYEAATIYSIRFLTPRMLHPNPTTREPPIV